MFYGSANFTTQAWDNAMNGRDELRVTTNVPEMIERHDKYFVPVWIELMNKQLDENIKKKPQS
jgi:hypothetical protein